MNSLGDISKKGARLFPEKTAVVFEETRLTYKELNNRVNCLAYALTNLGIQKKERLAILAENTYKYLEVYFAAAKAGLSVTPLNFRLSDREIVHIINDSEATVLLVGEGYEERSQVIKKDLNNIRFWISLEGHQADFLEYEALIAEGRDVEPDLEVDENDLMILMYTGGTTGLPKGVMLSHRNILSAMFGLIISWSITRRDRECFILPMFHISIWPVLCTLIVGGSVVILRRPELQDTLSAIQTEKCTRIVLVPTLLMWMLELHDLAEYNLSSLRTITYAGSPMPPEVLKRCVHKFGNIFGQGYGLTEAAPLGTALLPEDHAFEGENVHLLDSIGKEGTTAEVRVVDMDDRPVNSGEVGEIVIRGKNVMMGYWKNPELTAETLRGGWLHTGDLGKTDERDYIYLVDRKADMIVTGGENVYPKETEDVIYEHPAVQECAVISAPDEKWGERVQAVVTLKAGCFVTEQELIAHCKQKLAGYKCPKDIQFWDELPKTSVGKIIRKEIKSRFWKGKEKLIG